MESRFFEPPRETKIGSKNQIGLADKFGVKLLCFTEERERFWLELSREARKIEAG